MPSEQAVRELVSTLEGGRGYETTHDNLLFGLRDLAIIQEHVSGLVPDAVTSDKPTKDQIRTYFLALIKEEMELMDELGWKPWKDTPVDSGKIVDEFADVLAFLGLIIHYLDQMGISQHMLAKGYIVKTIRNYHRFTDGNGEKGYGSKL
jgi:NTP pyrophosphatase (non-canonical NTP hydrolase)